ncbi:MAG: oligosaccharide flippase family protein [Gemmatimonadota bacterium]
MAGDVGALRAPSRFEAPRGGSGPDARRLARGYLLLGGGELLAKLLTFTAFVALGRALGPERYGSLEFVLAVMVFFTLPADLGLGAYGAREVARRPGAAALLLQQISELRLLLAGVSFAALLAVTALVPAPDEVRLLLVLYGVSLFAAPALLQWLFQGQGLMQWVAAASITRQAVFAGLILVLVRPGVSIVAVGLVEIASVAATAAVCVTVARLRLGVRVPAPRLRPAGLARHLREAAPIGLSEIAWAGLWYLATVLLGLLVAGPALGWFGASHRIVMALHTFVWLYFVNLLPWIARGVEAPREQLVRLIQGSLLPATWCSLFVALVTTVLARDLLTLAYGPAFADAGRTLGLLVWMVPLAMLSGHFRYTLIAYDLQRLELASTLAAGLVAAVLGLLLIPRFAGRGAAAALLCGSAVNGLLAYAWTRSRVARIRLGGRVAKPLVAATAALALFAALGRLEAWQGALAAVASYVLILAAWQRSELPALRALLPGKAPWRGGAQ